MSEVAELAERLGIGEKRLARLLDKKGDDLLPWLKKCKEWAERQDRDRYLHRNPGSGRSDYTFTHYNAMRSGDQETGIELAVPAAYQTVLVMEAKARFAKHRQENAKQEQAEESARQVSRQLRDLAVAIHRNGGDPVEFLAGVQRQITEKRNELRDAA